MSIMGGVVVGAGHSTATEFNLASDLSAARCVLDSRVPLRWIPLNAAASVVMPQGAIDEFRAAYPRSRVASTIAKLLSFTARMRDRGGLPAATHLSAVPSPAQAGAAQAGAVVPDAVALALALDPGLGRWRLCRLGLKDRSRLGRLSIEPGIPNAQLCEAVDGPRVSAMLWSLWSQMVERDAAHS